MQFARESTNLLVEQSLDQRVHVLVRCADRGTVGQLIGDAIEAAEQLRFFMGSDDPRATECVHPRFARGDVLWPEAMIDGEAAI